MSGYSIPKPTVLAVDDSIVMHELIQQALSENYHVLLVDNAMEALTILYQQQVSLVLLDITLPEIDGLELCRTVRSLPQLQHLPIIMLTARDGAFDQVQGHLAGATEYLTKPFKSQHLVEVIERILQTPS